MFGSISSSTNRLVCASCYAFCAFNSFTLPMQYCVLLCSWSSKFPSSSISTKEHNFDQVLSFINNSYRVLFLVGYSLWPSLSFWVLLGLELKDGSICCANGNWSLRGERSFGSNSMLPLPLCFLASFSLLLPLFQNFPNLSSFAFSLALVIWLGHCPLCNTNTWAVLIIATVSWFGLLRMF